MIYGDCIHEQSTTVTEYDIVGNMLTESIDMMHSTLDNYINIIAEGRTTSYVNEASAKGMFKSVCNFIKKAVEKLREFIIKAAKFVLAVMSQYLVLIAPLYKYTIGYTGKHYVLKSGVDKLIDKIPKSAMGDIKTLLSKSANELESIIYNSDGTKINQETIRSKAMEVINSIIKPYHEEITDLDKINVMSFLEEESTGLTTTGAYLMECKLRINKYKSVIKTITQKGEKLCKSYNADIAELDRMSFAESKPDQDKDSAIRDSLVLEVVRGEYAGLFFVANSIIKLQYNLFNFIIRRYQTIYNVIKDEISDPKYKSIFKHKKESK